MVGFAADATDRGAGAAGRAAGAAATEERGAPAGGGETLPGAELGRGAGAPGGVDAGAGVTAGPADAGPPAGTEGSLIVALGFAAGGGAPTALGGTGPAPGFGGKLMRTVSFFGWILALSAGLGGIPEGGGGGTGLLSAINLLKP
jgi:hypothetical protein